MSSLNKCQFIGNLGKDPEIKSINQDTKVAQFSLGCSDSYKNKAGEKVETTEWINVTAWNKLAEIIEKYVKKGDKVYISGKMVTQSYEKDGAKVYRTLIVADELIMLTSKSKEITVQRNDIPNPASSITQYPERITAPDEQQDNLPF